MKDCIHSSALRAMAADVFESNLCPICLNAENERLRTKLEKTVKGFERLGQVNRDLIDKLDKLVKFLETENEKLRAALREIRKWLNGEPTSRYYNDGYKIISEALKGAE